jgi:DNA-binding FrmR family transcriptional regulator
MDSIIKYFTKILSSDNQVKNINLDNYQGRRHQVSDGKGNILSDIDGRDIFAEKASKLKEFKIKAFEETTENASIVDQINALSGRLSSAEINLINTTIVNTRQKYQAKKQQVLDSLTLDEIDSITWED